MIINRVYASIPLFYTIFRYFYNGYITCGSRIQECNMQTSGTREPLCETPQRECIWSKEKPGRVGLKGN
jgi:hypothetical protein